jgi:transposase InsO family protein
MLGTARLGMPVVTSFAAEGGRAVLVELSVMELRYHAVMEVISGAPVTRVARRYGVSRQAVRLWLGRYRKEGLAGLAGHSRRPRFRPRRLSAGVGAMICQLRGAHPRGGPRRLQYEPGRARVAPARSRPAACRVLVRRGLVPARKHRRRRQDCRRWQREAPVRLWQVDITGPVFLTGGAGLRLISGIGGHSRFCVIAAVVRCGAGRAVCRAFFAAMRSYGIPGEVLTGNGRQFTGGFGRPRPAEVLFERICRRDGIRQLLARPCSPATAGRAERWHQALQAEFLSDAGPLPRSGKPGPRSVSGGRNTPGGGRASPRAWPALLISSGPQLAPRTAWRCGLLVTSGPAPPRCGDRLRHRSSRSP